MNAFYVTLGVPNKRYASMDDVAIVEWLTRIAVQRAGDEGLVVRALESKNVRPARWNAQHGEYEACEERFATAVLIVARFDVDHPERHGFVHTVDVGGYL